MDMSWLEEASDSALDAALKAKEDSSAGGNTYGNLFKPKIADNGVGKYVVRLLPAPPGEEDPFVFYREHNIWSDAVGNSHRELCGYTYGVKCPVCDHAYRMKKSSEDEARRFFAKRRYAANVLIIQDDQNPENEGTIKTWEYGPVIAGMIEKAIDPVHDHIKPKSVFDVTGKTGADFYVVVKKVAGYYNYDDSDFGERGPLFGGDKKKIMAAFKDAEIPSLATGRSKDSLRPSQTIKDELFAFIAAEGDATDMPETKKPPKKAVTEETGDDSGEDAVEATDTEDFFASFAE